MAYIVLSQVDGPSMFPTFTGRGDWVLAEALPGLSDRVQVGAWQQQQQQWGQCAEVRTVESTSKRVG
jgi:signal peptidase I